MPIRGDTCRQQPTGTAPSSWPTCPPFRRATVTYPVDQTDGQLVARHLGRRAAHCPDDSAGADASSPPGVAVTIVVMELALLFCAAVAFALAALTYDCSPNASYSGVAPAQGRRGQRPHALGWVTQGRVVQKAEEALRSLREFEVIWEGSAVISDLSAPASGSGRSHQLPGRHSSRYRRTTRSSR